MLFLLSELHEIEVLIAQVGQGVQAVMEGLQANGFTREGYIDELRDANQVPPASTFKVEFYRHVETKKLYAFMSLTCEEKKYIVHLRHVGTRDEMVRERVKKEPRKPRKPRTD